MARNTFRVARYGNERTDPQVTGDRVEEKNGKFILLDEHDKEVYSVATTEGQFLSKDGEGRWVEVGISPSHKG